MRRRCSLVALISCLLGIMACGLPQAAGPTPRGAIDTLVAQTVAAMDGAGQTAPSASPSPTVFVTPLPQPVLLTVSLATNCRAGPGREYDLLDVLNVGETAQAVGRYPAANYWIIQKPHGAGLCWLWGEYVTVVGGGGAAPARDDPAALPNSAAFPNPAALDGDLRPRLCALRTLAGKLSAHLSRLGRDYPERRRKRDADLPLASQRQLYRAGAFSPGRRWDV